MCKLTLHSRFSGHKGSIYSIETLNAGDFLTAGSEGIIAAWNINHPEEGSLLARVPGVVYTMLKLNDEFLLAGTSLGAIHVISLKEKREARLLQYHHSPVFRIAHWKEKQLVFSLDGQGQIQVYDEGLNPLHSFSPVAGKLRDIVFTDEAFITGTSEGKILRYDAAFNLLNEYQAHQQNFGVNALWLDGDTIISGSRDAHLVISDFVTGAILNKIPAHNYAIYDITENPVRHNLIATASRDKTIKLWSLPGFNMLQRLDATLGGHVNSVNDIAWLDEDTLISAGDDRAALAWKIST